MKTFTEGPYATFAEETTDALLDKERYLVALGTAEGTVKLAADGDTAIGVLSEKREGDPHVTVRLLGKGGTLKVIAGGVIAKDARVIWGTGGKVITRPATAGLSHRTLGRKLSQGNSASGDIIEILDLVEVVKVVSVVAAPAAAAPADGVFAGLNSTAVNPTKSDFDALLVQLELLNDSHIATVAKLTAIHTALVANGTLAIA